MDKFVFRAYDFSPLESCQLYIITKCKASNYCKLESIIQRCSFLITLLFRKPLCQSLFLIKLQLKNRLWHRCFSVNIAKFLRTPFYRTPLVCTSGKIGAKSLKLAKFQFQLFLTILDKWYHSFPLHCDIIVVKRDIHRKIFVVVSKLQNI